MALDLAALRERFNKPTEASEGGGGFWDKFYPFYKMDNDATATIRLLPDADPDNQRYFIVENKYHELLVNGKKQKIACLRMYDKQCPCCDLASKFYGEKDESMGKKYYRKLDYLVQALVINSPFDYPIKPDENPVRLISISKQLHARITAGIMNPDMDVNPLDYQEGFDFRIIKRHDGKYANYNESEFARRSTPIPADLQARIELYDLKTFRLQEKPVELMEQWIEADRTGASIGNAAPQSRQNTGSQRVDQQLDTAANKGVETPEQLAAAASGTPVAPSTDRAKSLLDQIRRNKPAA